MSVVYGGPSPAPGRARAGGVRVRVCRRGVRPAFRGGVRNCRCRRALGGGPREPQLEVLRRVVLGRGLPLRARGARVDRVLVSRVDSRARGRPGRVVDDAGGVDSRAVGPGVESKRRRPANLPSRARVWRRARALFSPRVTTGARSGASDATTRSRRYLRFGGDPATRAFRTRAKRCTDYKTRRRRSRRGDHALGLRGSTSLSSVSEA